MGGLNVAQLLIVATAILMMVSPLFVLVFLAGRQSATPFSNPRFDRMRPDFVLAAGSWQIEYDGDDPSTPQSIIVHLQQTGCRVVAGGDSPDGTRHSLEGVLHQRKLCCVSIDENREGKWLGTVTAELLPGERQIVGMRSRWSPILQVLVVRKASLTFVGDGM